MSLTVSLSLSLCSSFSLSLPMKLASCNFFYRLSCAILVSSTKILIVNGELISLNWIIENGFGEILSDYSDNAYSKESVFRILSLLLNIALKFKFSYLWNLFAKITPSPLLRVFRADRYYCIIKYFLVEKMASFDY